MKGSANGAAFLPSAKKSWITLSSDYAAADGSTPVTAILELRTSDGAGRADLFDSSRLVPRVTLGRDALPTPAVERRGPGLFAYTVDVPRGSGGQTMTFGATFDGADVVAPRAIPVAADPWLGAYPVEAKGGCSAAARASDRGGWSAVLGGFAALAAAAGARRRRRRRAS